MGERRLVRQREWARKADQTGTEGSDDDGDGDAPEHIAPVARRRRSHRCLTTNRATPGDMPAHRHHRRRRRRHRRANRAIDRPRGRRLHRHHRHLTATAAALPRTIARVPKRTVLLRRHAASGDRRSKRAVASNTPSNTQQYQVIPTHTLFFAPKTRRQPDASIRLSVYR